MTIQLKKTLRGVMLALAAGTTAFAGTAAFAAAAFPNKPIRIIVTTTPGANLDILTRTVAEQMSQNLGQPVFVENMASSGAILGILQVAKRSPADGYTLLAASNTVVLAPAFKKNPRYDPVKDLTGIGDMQVTPYIMVGAPTLHHKTLAEFIAAAKANPGSMSIASGGVGTTTYVPALLLMHQVGVNLMHVPYKGNASAMSDIVGGRVDAIFDAGITAGPMIAEGRLRAFGVSTAKRLAAFPNIPTFAEQGLPNFYFRAYMGMYVRAGTPKDIVTRLHEALRVATSSDALREMYRKGGSEAGSMGPEEFNEFIKKDVLRSAKLASDLGIEKE